MSSDDPPSVDVHVAVESGRIPISQRRVRDVAMGVLRAERARDAVVSVTFVSRRAIAEMNREHLDHRGATDVISFGFTRAAPTDPVIGDIYICPDVAREQARAHGAGVRQELARLVVHGVLHVMGHDHPAGDERTKSPMWKRQEQLVERLAPARLR